MNSNSVIKIWFDKSGKLTQNQSFAVVNEKLENIGDIGVNEESSAYEILPQNFVYGSIKIHADSDFDKYQKLIYSDFKDQGTFPMPKV